MAKEKYPRPKTPHPRVPAVPPTPEILPLQPRADQTGTEAVAQGSAAVIEQAEMMLPPPMMADGCEQICNGTGPRDKLTDRTGDKTAEERRGGFRDRVRMVKLWVREAFFLC